MGEKKTKQNEKKRDKKKASKQSSVAAAAGDSFPLQKPILIKSRFWQPGDQ